MCVTIIVSCRKCHMNMFSTTILGDCSAHTNLTTQTQPFTPNHVKKHHHYLFVTKCEFVPGTPKYHPHDPVLETGYNAHGYLESDTGYQQSIKSRHHTRYQQVSARNLTNTSGTTSATHAIMHGKQTLKNLQVSKGAHTQCHIAFYDAIPYKGAHEAPLVLISIVNT
jgi:hypothetical protein